MVESERSVGKNTDTQGPPLLVVAAALRRSDGTWLMHRRPLEKHHGGLWEFPGGKVETAELPATALKRELLEELGILVREQDCTPSCFAEERAAQYETGIVILLYTVERWEGDAHSLEGGAVDWFTPAQIAELAKPPLDQELAASLFAKV